VLTKPENEYKGIKMRIAALHGQTPHNKPVRADCWEILVVLQGLVAAAQPERYADYSLVRAI
jgi:hypothetical protein